MKTTEKSITDTVNKVLANTGISAEVFESEVYLDFPALDSDYASISILRDRDSDWYVRITGTLRADQPVGNMDLTFMDLVDIAYRLMAELNK